MKKATVKAVSEKKGKPNLKADEPAWMSQGAPGASSSTTTRRVTPTAVRRPAVKEFPPTLKSPQAKRGRTKAELPKKSQKPNVSTPYSSIMAAQVSASASSTTITNARPLLVTQPPIIDLCTPPGFTTKVEDGRNDKGLAGPQKRKEIFIKAQTEPSRFPYQPEVHQDRMAGPGTSGTTHPVVPSQIPETCTQPGPSGSEANQSKRRKLEEDINMTDVYFDCPTLGLQSLKEVEMHREIFKHLLHESDDGTGKLQSLMIRSCNRPGIDLTTCISTLLTNLDELLETPDNRGAKTIPCDTPFFKNVMFHTLGLAGFLKTAGYTAYYDAYRFEGDARKAKPRLEIMKAMLETTKAIPLSFSRNLKVFKPGTPVAEYTAFAPRRQLLRKNAPGTQQNSKYKYTDIVIQLPDSSALMGTFKTTESVADVYDFVQSNLMISSYEFVLKNILYQGIAVNNSRETLRASRLGLVPSAILGFQHRVPTQQLRVYLKPKLFYNVK